MFYPRIQIDIVFGIKKLSEYPEFSLKRYEIDVLDYKRIGESVLHLQSLQILRLHRSLAGDDHIRLLIQGLIFNKTLIVLDLSQCKFGDAGALCIAKFLMSHPCLRYLNLSLNKITETGAQGLAYALSQDECCPLEVLNLRLNPLKHEGTMQILSFLARNGKLFKVNLAGVGFDYDTCSRFSEMLSSNANLNYADVSCNYFGVEGGHYLLENLERNKSLRRLDLRETDIPKDIEESIRLILKHRNMIKDVEEVMEESSEATLEQEDTIVLTSDEWSLVSVKPPSIISDVDENEDTLSQRRSRLESIAVALSE